MKKYLSIDEYLSDRDEDIRDVMLYARKFIKEFHPDITEALQYGCPFFSFRGKKLCYLHSNKKRQVYLGFVDGSRMQHSVLIAGDRTHIKIFDLDPEKDIQISKLKQVLKMALELRS